MKHLLLMLSFIISFYGYLYRIDNRATLFLKVLPRHKKYLSDRLLNANKTIMKLLLLPHHKKYLCGKLLNANETFVKLRLPAVAVFLLEHFSLCGFAKGNQGLNYFLRPAILIHTDEITSKRIKSSS